ncbi:MAG: GMC family oxidoreductase N-terminal domain-containing protein [Chitinophagales bacterium]
MNDSKINIEDGADFIIVGSGCAGSTVARWLSAAGKSVIIVEEGAPPKPVLTDNALETMKTLYRDAGAFASIGNDPVPLLQGRCVGGGSYINCAIQIRFPEWVWQQWVAQDKKWEQLLPWKDLMDANDILDKELKIAPTPPALYGENGGTMLKAWGEKAEPISRSTPGCKGSGKCMQGCPHGAKESTDKNYIPMAVANGARLYSSCEVRKVIIKNRRAVGIEGRFASGGKFTARAKVAVVLAASAVQTPWLLLKSGLSLEGNGFMCHPGAAMAGLFEKKITGMPEATQSAQSTYWGKENIKFESLGMPKAFRAARVPGAGKLLQSRLEKLDHVALWGVACKAQARGKVSRGPFGPLVRYSPTDFDRKNILRGLSMMAEAMLEQGATEVWPSVYGAPEIITTVDQARAIADLKCGPGVVPMAATHLFCGVEVREKFQVKDIDGLVIADSSFFPSNIGVNPMTAIMSAATLVAKTWI